MGSGENVTVNIMGQANQAGVPRVKRRVGNPRGSWSQLGLDNWEVELGASHFLGCGPAWQGRQSLPWDCGLGAAVNI